MIRVKLDVPGDRIQPAIRSLHNFRKWSSVLLAKADFKGAEAITWSEERQACLVVYTNPHGKSAPWGVEHKIIAEAITRMVAVRSRRRNPDGSLLPVPKQWWNKVREGFAPMFDACREQEVCDGWIDLSLALADWCWELNESTPGRLLRFEVFAARDGLLYSDATGYDDVLFQILEAFDMLSGHICETCGAPGKTYDRGSVLHAVTRCGDHAPGKECEDE